MAPENWARQCAVKTEPVTELRADASCRQSTPRRVHQTEYGQSLKPA
jgi:hypothetical protein